MVNDSFHTTFDEFNKNLKLKVHDEAISFFDDLVQKSNMNLPKYNEIYAQYSKENDLLNKENKTLKGLLSKKTLYQTLETIFAILSIILLVLFIISLGSEWYKPFLYCIFALGSGAISITLAVSFKNKYKPLIDESKKDKKELEDKVNSLIKDLYNLLSPLNALFDWNMQNEIITKAFPLIQLDQNFDIKKYSYLNEKYGFAENESNKVSVLTVQSGSIVGNPFLIYRTLNNYIGDKAYGGSVTYTYTTRDSKGRVRTHTDTLYASINKPFPYYYNDTILALANDVAPNLNFSRKKTVPLNSSKKEIENLIESQINVIEKKEKRALSEGKEFTPLGNPEFDALFNALDRDNETQFRLLFPPSAQLNYLDLLTAKEPYGDDFSFIKRGPLNFIKSDHSQNFNYSVDPNYFVSFSLEESKKRFVNYCDDYFQNIFFDLLPLLSIPLYTQHKPIEYIYNKEFSRNFNKYEAEVAVNSLNLNLLKHKDTDTNVILKTELIRKNDDYDDIKCYAYSFKGEPRIDYVTKIGRDGLPHSIPIPWVEYFELKKENYVKLKSVDMPRNNFFKNVNSNINIGNQVKQCNLKRGVFCALLDENNLVNDNESLNSLFK